MNKKVLHGIVLGISIFSFLVLSFFVFIIIKSDVIDIKSGELDYWLLFKDLLFIGLWLLLGGSIIWLFKKGNKNLK
ncbi:MAG: hypothetical protein K9M44_01035 [Candidatus Pacebacteria bacterium]|nr:hypothetical protein [Candidatus Paceibacterota bacterium]